MKGRNNRNGFSLIELVLVVAVILIIAAIAIPNLLRSKMSANEASVVGSLGAVNAACVNYSTTWGKGFPVSLKNLGPGKNPATSAAAGMIDSVVAGGTKTGYKLTYVSGSPTKGTVSTYTIKAKPSVPNKTGVRYFFTDQSGVIRYNVGRPATASSKPIG